MRIFCNIKPVLNISRRMSCNFNARQYTSLVQVIRSKRLLNDGKLWLSSSMQKYYNDDNSIRRVAEKQPESLKMKESMESHGGNNVLLPVALLDLGPLNAKSTKILLFPLNWPHGNESTIHSALSAIFYQKNNTKRIEAFSNALKQVSDLDDSLAIPTSEKLLKDAANDIYDQSPESEISEQPENLEEHSESAMLEKPISSVHPTSSENCSCNCNCNCNKTIDDAELTPGDSVWHITRATENGENSNNKNGQQLSFAIVMKSDALKLNFEELVFQRKYGTEPLSLCARTFSTNINGFQLPAVYSGFIDYNAQKKCSNDTSLLPLTIRHISSNSSSKGPLYNSPFVSELLGGQKYPMNSDTYRKALIEAQRRRAALKYAAPTKRIKNCDRPLVIALKELPTNSQNLPKNEVRGHCIHKIVSTTRVRQRLPKNCTAPTSTPPNASSKMANTAGNVYLDLYTIPNPRPKEAVLQVSPVGLGKSRSASTSGSISKGGKGAGKSKKPSPCSSEDDYVPRCNVSDPCSQSSSCKKPAAGGGSACPAKKPASSTCNKKASESKCDAQKSPPPSSDTCGKKAEKKQQSSCRKLDEQQKQAAANLPSSKPEEKKAPISCAKKEADKAKSCKRVPKCNKKEPQQANVKKERPKATSPKKCVPASAEDADANKPSACAKKDDPCSKKVDPCAKKADTCAKKSGPTDNKPDPCAKKADPCAKKADKCAKKENPCAKKSDSSASKLNPCAKPAATCSNKPDPCAKKADPCAKKADTCPKKADPCAKKADICAKKDESCPTDKPDPCAKKADPCAKKADPCAKKADTCAKKADSGAKKADTCAKKDESGPTDKPDPCSKKADPCAKKADPCAKKADTCAKKSDSSASKPNPCAMKADKCSKKDDPCAKKDDPCAKKEDPCAKKEDPCAKKDDPCAKKDDPCGKKPSCGKKTSKCPKKADKCSKKKKPMGCEKVGSDPCGKKATACSKKEAKNADTCVKKEVKKAGADAKEMKMFDPCAKLIRPRSSPDYKTLCQPSSKWFSTTSMLNGCDLKPKSRCLSTSAIKLPKLFSESRNGKKLVTNNNIKSFGFMRHYSSKDGSGQKDHGDKSRCDAVAIKKPPNRTPAPNPHPKDGLRLCYPSYELDCPKKLCKDPQNTACCKYAFLRDTDTNKRKENKKSINGSLNKRRDMSTLHPHNPLISIIAQQKHNFHTTSDWRRKFFSKDLQFFQEPERQEPMTAHEIYDQDNTKKTDIMLYNETLSITDAYKVERVIKSVPHLSDYDVLVRTSSIAISGSDIHVYENGTAIYPGISLGHDASGVVVKTGRYVTELKKGDRVTMEPSVSCGICDFCKRGDYNMCYKLIYNGFFMQYQSHPADLCHKIPDSISMSEASLSHTLALGCHAISKANISPNSNILIMGCGPTAVAAGLCAQAKGAKEVAFLCTMRDTLVTIKDNFYVPCIVNDNGFNKSQLLDTVFECFNAWPDVVVNCSVNEETMSIAALCLKPCGVCVLAQCDTEVVHLNALDVLMKNIKLVPSFRSANMFPCALQLLSSGAIPVDKIIASNFRWDNVSDAFRVAQIESNNGYKKVIVEFHGSRI